MSSPEPSQTPIPSPEFRSVETQLSTFLAATVRPRPVRMTIPEAQGLLCAEDVVVQQALPGFDQAAVDGYAVRSVDVRTDDEQDVQLPVVGEIPAGSRQPRRLQPGQAVRVVTGAPLPTLADAVVPTAFTDGDPAQVTVHHSVPSHSYVRRTGEDAQGGDVAVRSGDPVGAAQVGLLAAVGRSRVLVHPRPRVSIIAVGDELVDVDRSPSMGQVYDVNSYALAAAARDAGAEVSRVGIVPLDARRLRETIDGRLLMSEVIVVVGGAGGSTGEEVQSALSGLGDIDSTRVAMHPGSTQAFGRLGTDAVPTCFLPTNPMSALVMFEVMVRPLIRAARGVRNPHRRTIEASLLSSVTSVKGRRGYLRGQLLRDESNGEYLVQPLGHSGSHQLASLAAANCLITIDEDLTEVAAGGQVSVTFLAQQV